MTPEPKALMYFQSPEDLADIIININIDINEGKVRHGSKSFHATICLILSIPYVIGTII